MQAPLKLLMRTEAGSTDSGDPVMEGVLVEVEDAEAVAEGLREDVAEEDAVSEEEAVLEACAPVDSVAVAEAVWEAEEVPVPDAVRLEVGVLEVVAVAEGEGVVVGVPEGAKRATFHTWMLSAFRVTTATGARYLRRRRAGAGEGGERELQ